MLKVFLATLISYGHQLATIKHSSSINLLIIVWTKRMVDWLPSYIIIVLFAFITWPLSLGVFFSSSCLIATQIHCLHKHLLVQIFSKCQNKTSSTTIRVDPVQLIMLDWKMVIWYLSCDFWCYMCSLITVLVQFYRLSFESFCVLDKSRQLFCLDDHFELASSNLHYHIRVWPQLTKRQVCKVSRDTNEIMLARPSKQ